MNSVHKINIDILDSGRYNQRNNLELYLKEIKMLNTVFELFIKESPISVISRSAMERTFNSEKLDQWLIVQPKNNTQRICFFPAFLTSWHRLSAKAGHP